MHQSSKDQKSKAYKLEPYKPFMAFAHIKYKEPPNEHSAAGVNSWSLSSTGIFGNSNIENIEQGSPNNDADPQHKYCKVLPHFIKRMGYVFKCAIPADLFIWSRDVRENT